MSSYEAPKLTVIGDLPDFIAYANEKYPHAFQETTNNQSPENRVTAYLSRIAEEVKDFLIK